MNGPGTPRPLNRPKVSLASSLTANGLPDSTDNKDTDTDPDGDKDSRYVRILNTPGAQSKLLVSRVSLVSYFIFSEVSASGGSPGSSVKNKHDETEEDMEAEQQEVKRLKFSKDEEEEDEDEEEEHGVDALRPSDATCHSKEAEAMVQEEEEEEKVAYKEDEASSSAAATEDQGRCSSVLFVHWLWTLRQ